LCLNARGYPAQPARAAPERLVFGRVVEQPGRVAGRHFDHQDGRAHRVTFQHLHGIVLDPEAPTEAIHQRPQFVAIALESLPVADLPLSDQVGCHDVSFARDRFWE
jgi:hypothetical protein